MIASSGRPCSDSKAQSCWLQPSRAAASANADGAGMQIMSSGEKRRISIVPTPKKNGSPLASTQTGLPRQAAITSSASSIGDGQTSVSAPTGPTSARCRRPPTTRAACATRLCAAGESPSIPSSPMPTTASQRSPLMEPSPEALSPPHSRRNLGSERARPPPGGRPERRRAAVAGRRDRQPGARADPAAGRRFRRGGGSGGVSSRRRDRRRRRRHPPVRRAHVGQRRRGMRHGR